MNDLLNKTQELCRIYDIKPQKNKGQNFLVDSSVYEKIIETAQISKEDLVLEVGPGLGFLSAKLIEKAKEVTAVELDEKIVSVLEIALESQAVDNFKVVSQNILDFDIESFVTDYKIVANLPYNITSVFLRKFLSSSNKPKTMTLMLQKEVAERIIAKEGNHSLLSLSVQYYSQPKYIETVRKEHFWPQPKVDSAILKLEIKSEKEFLLNKEEEKVFFRLLKFGFSAKRKKLANNLAGALRIEVNIILDVFNKLKVDKNVRAQELSLKDWHNLFADLKAFML